MLKTGEGTDQSEIQLLSALFLPRTRNLYEVDGNKFFFLTNVPWSFCDKQIQSLESLELTPTFKISTEYASAPGIFPHWTVNDVGVASNNVGASTVDINSAIFEVKT